VAKRNQARTAARMGFASGLEIFAMFELPRKNNGQTVSQGKNRLGY